MTLRRVVLTLVLGLGLSTWAQPLAWGQTPAQRERDHVTTARKILALTYPEGLTLSIKLDGTTRLPDASGEAKVERKLGMTEIEIELDEMKPATLFGGDYNTYVLWVVSPEGHVDNVGEFILNGNRSRLNVSTPLETFGLFVTAEPHFLVATPSRFVALENTRPTRDPGLLVRVSELEYRGFEGVYLYEAETLAQMPEANNEVRPHLGAARTAVELAARAGAATHASTELQAARTALERAEEGAALGTRAENQMLLAHEVIRLAVAAQQTAERRAFDQALEDERRARADDLARVAQSLENARNDAERARLEADRKALQAEMEADARAAAQARADEEARRATLAEQERAAEAERAARAEQERHAETERAARAERARDAAEQDREAARDRLRVALERITSVEDTARGLIVNIPNVLFDFGEATLRPQGRETVAKISGVLLIATGYKLQIEGHTDSVGSDEFNERLGRNRAASVRDYLASQGIAGDLIRVTSYGETRPVASNDTEHGRQLNRRVEIIVEEGPRFAVPLTQ